MAKLNPLLLLGGAAAALYFVSQKKKGDKKSSGKPSSNTCGETSIGGIKLKDFALQLKPNPAENSPEIQAAMQSFLQEKALPFVSDPQHQSAFKEDYLGHSVEVANEIAPDCFVTKEQIKELAKSTQGEPPPMSFAQGMEGVDLRLAFFLLVTSSCAGFLLKQGVLTSEDMIKSAQKWGAE
jgi:hypothetical protein